MVAGVEESVALVVVGGTTTADDDVEEGKRGEMFVNVCLCVYVCVCPVPSYKKVHCSCTKTTVKCRKTVGRGLHTHACWGSPCLWHPDSGARVHKDTLVGHALEKLTIQQRNRQKRDSGSPNTIVGSGSHTHACRGRPSLWRPDRVARVHKSALVGHGGTDKAHSARDSAGGVNCCRPARALVRARAHVAHGRAQERCALGVRVRGEGGRNEMVWK